MILMLAAGLLLAGGFAAEPQTKKEPEMVSFKKKIKPLLKRRCGSCHGSSGSLNLRSYKSLMKGGKSGKVIIPKNSAKSLLYKRIIGKGGARMPRSKPPLKKSDKDLIKLWIDQGAKDN
jgi:mono/diheme cytochrome c family protein